MRCFKFYMLQDYEDERFGEYVNELLQNINKELGDLLEGDEEEWGESDDEDEDEDEEMKGQKVWKV